MPVTGVGRSPVVPTFSLDTGAVLLQDSLPISSTDTSATLHDRLAAIGARLVVQGLHDLAAGRLRPQAQPAEGVTYAKKIDKAEARIDWSKPAAEVHNLIRGLSPFPGAWFEAPSEKGPVRVKALLSRVEAADGAEALLQELSGDVERDY